MKQKGLQELCLRLLAENIDCCPTLESIPAELCDRLVELVLERHSPKPQTLRLLGTMGLANVSTLDLSMPNTELSEGVLLSLLGSIESLRALALRDEPRGSITAKVLKKLSTSHQELRSLSLSKCTNIKNAGLGFLLQLRRLGSLRLDGFRNITGEGLENLRNLGELKELFLVRCPTITTLEFVPRRLLHHQLQTLDLSFTGIRGDQLRGFLLGFTKGPSSSSARLRKLFLQGLSLSPKMVSEEIATLGTTMPSLTSLSLAGNVNIGREAELLRFSGWTTPLAALDLSRTLVNSAGFGVLAASGLEGRLRVLGLAETAVTQEGVILNLPRFRVLELIDLCFNTFTSPRAFRRALGLHSSLKIADLRFCEWLGESAEPEQEQQVPEESAGLGYGGTPRMLLSGDDEADRVSIQGVRNILWQLHFSG